jgi:hypothetical protein
MKVVSARAMLIRRCLHCSRRLATALETTDLLQAYKAALTRGDLLPDEGQLRLV